MVHIPTNKRRKFDKKSKMILVGYSETIKGYRLYNPRYNTVITSRDVIIMENVENQEETVINLDDELITK